MYILFSNGYLTRIEYPLSINTLIYKGTNYGQHARHN